MEIYSSDDELDRSSERFGSYSLSADVSESESSGSFSHRQCDHEAGTSSALASSPIPRPAFAASSIPTARMNVNFPVTDGTNVVVPVTKTENPETELSEVELMKERFAKLLLGEDMSGGSKGVCTALAVSNAITNLSAAVFGEVWKLEPLPPQKKSMWRREMDWLLCVSDSIVELIPSLQEFPEGGTFEVMVTRPRSDLYVNLPALKKLDAMLLSILDGFHDSEFYYCDRGIIVPSDSERLVLSSSSSTGTPSIRREGKWWLPFPKVPSNGLSDDATKRLQQCRECTNQILKAALAINGNVLAEMEIPSVYLQNLPKSGKACLGEIVYRYMTAGKFSPECLLDYLDLSSEYTTLEIANRVEAAVHIWKQKCLKRHPTLSKSGKTSWSEKVKGLASDVERNRLLANRAETLLRNLKMRFPGLPQTTLDMTKIQYNKDVGHAILESYSRVLESLAFNIMARIDDLLYINDATKRRAAFADSICLNDHGRFGNTSLPKQKRISRGPSSVQHASSGSRIKATTLHPRIPIGGHGSPSERTHRLVRRTTTSDAEEERFEEFSSDSK